MATWEWECPDCEHTNPRSEDEHYTEARCLIDWCEWGEDCQIESPKEAVAFVRELLISHLYLEHNKKAETARVNLVLADGVTA